MDETVELEVKVAWLENQVSELDAVVRGLGDELAALRREVEELRAAGRTRRPGDAEGEEAAEDADGMGLRYEKPPHY